MVGVQGFEPWTPCSQSRCATRLRYTPTEPIFYTGIAVLGKSCKIRSMGLLLTSKLNKQFRALLVCGILILSLLGTQSLGFTHGIAHAGFQGSNSELHLSTHSSPAISHGPAACHLFDALTLASFIAPHIQASVNTISHKQSNPQLSNLTSPQVSWASYQSRAPPSLTL